MTAEIHATRSSSTSTQTASMGPRSDDRGDEYLDIARETKAALQWGRGPMTAEMDEKPVELPRWRLLQWGRGPMTAEIVSARFR